MFFCDRVLLGSPSWLQIQFFWLYLHLLGEWLTFNPPHPQSTSLSCPLILLNVFAVFLIFFSVTSQSFSTINRFLIYWCKASDPEANLGHTETILERRQEGRADEREEEQKKEQKKWLISKNWLPILMKKYHNICLLPHIFQVPCRKYKNLFCQNSD